MEVKVSMVDALKILASLSVNGENTIIEDMYCATCTIRSKMKTIERLHDKMIAIDEPRNLVIGVGGIYRLTNGITEPIYRVLV